jgi:hypothetical protein
LRTKGDAASGVGLERLPTKADASSVEAAVVDRPQRGSAGSKKPRLRCRRLPAAPLGRGEMRRPLRVGREMKRDGDKDARRRKGGKHKRAAMKKPAREGDEKPHTLKGRRTNSASLSINMITPLLRSAVVFTRTSSGRYTRSTPA